MAEKQDAVADAANRLYWNSELSVADVARELDVSRRALYTIIQPLPTDAHCEVCGSPLCYANRTARDAGRMECATCAELEAPPAAPASERMRPRKRNDPGTPPARSTRAGPRGKSAPRVRFSGLALIGALVGALLGAGATVLATRD